MAVIDSTSPVINESSTTFWEDELTNLKILLNKIDLAIQTLITGNHASYELDTGQTTQRVTRQDLQKLTEWRDSLMSSIRDLELKIGIGKKGIRYVRPAF